MSESTRWGVLVAVALLAPGCFDKVEPVRQLVELRGAAARLLADVPEARPEPAMPVRPTGDEVDYRDVLEEIDQRLREPRPETPEPSGPSRPVEPDEEREAEPTAESAAVVPIVKPQPAPAAGKPSGSRCANGSCGTTVWRRGLFRRR